MATQAELIEQQFAEAGKGLARKRSQAQDELKTGLNRRQAMGGLTGGAAIKAQHKGVSELEEVFGTQEAGLNAEKAKAMQAALAQEEAKKFQTSEREASQGYGTQERLGGQQFASEQAGIGRQFQTQERLGTQDFGSGEALKGREFASGESAKDRSQQREQFDKSFGLQQKQFDETARQFNEGMRFQWADLNESQLSNMVNAMTAINNANLGNLQEIGRISSVIGKVGEVFRNQGRGTTAPTYLDTQSYNPSRLFYGA